MQPGIVDENLVITFEYDCTEDALHVYLEPVVDETFFVNLQHQPEIFMRLRCWGSSLVGVSVKPASVRLGTKAPAPDAMRQLAAGLVAQYGQMEHEEISRHQYKAVHKLDEDSDVTWSYEPFSESLYIDLEQGVTDRENEETDGYPNLCLRHARDDDRIVGMFMISVARYLGTGMPTRGQLRALARELVARYAPDP